VTMDASKRHGMLIVIIKRSRDHEIHTNKHRTSTCWSFFGSGECSQKHSYTSSGIRLCSYRQTSCQYGITSTMGGVPNWSSCPRQLGICSSGVASKNIQFRVTHIPVRTTI
jgi:hypothetical protein